MDSSSVSLCSVKCPLATLPENSDKSSNLLSESFSQFHQCEITRFLDVKSHKKNLKGDVKSNKLMVFAQMS